MHMHGCQAQVCAPTSGPSEPPDNHFSYITCVAVTIPADPHAVYNTPSSTACAVDAYLLQKALLRFRACLNMFTGSNHTVNLPTQHCR